MDVYEAIEKRRTIRTFKQGVSEEQLRKLLLAGVNAPSGSNVQPLNKSPSINISRV
jgi:nitroreductase